MECPECGGTEWDLDAGCKLRVNAPKAAGVSGSTVKARVEDLESLTAG